ncbi:MAG: hypothetical protein ACQSGP_14185, partial [Frankia sp.]
APDLSVLVMTSRADRGSSRDAEQFTAAARPPLRVATIIFARGGHNFLLWRAFEPYAFAWLSRHLTSPLTPTLPPTPGPPPPAPTTPPPGHRPTGLTHPPRGTRVTIRPLETRPGGHCCVGGHHGWAGAVRA